MANNTKKKDETTDIALLSPKMQEMMAFANEVSKSGIVPVAYAGRPAAIFAAIQYGREFGIPPMSALQNIAVINGKPTLGTDLMLALAMRHKDWGGYEIKTSTDTVSEVIVYRKLPSGKVASYPGKFTLADAQKAGLVRPSSPWEKWRARMLQHRAVAFAVRDAFPDVLAGTYSYEEMDPDKGASDEILEAERDDEIHAQVLDEKGVPVDVPVRNEPKIAPRSRAKKAAVDGSK